MRRAIAGRRHPSNDREKVLAEVTETGTENERASRFAFEIETAAPCVRRLNVTVEPEHVAATRRKEGAKLRKTVRLKGFRKGKVPPRVIEERYGPTIDERTVTALVNEGFREAVRSHELRTVGDPLVDDVNYEPGERLSFSVDVEVMPEINLERLGGFRIERPAVQVTDADIDEILEDMAKERATLEPVDRRAKEGDVVSVRIRPTDAEPGEETEQKPYRFELGAGYAIPDVEKAILTLDPGSTDVFEVTYPDDFGNEDLAGVTRSLEVELVDVRARRVSDIDDAFARDVGDFEGLDELRAAVREDLVRHRESEADSAVRDRLLDAVLDANAFEVPPGLVSSYLDRVLDAPEDADPEQLRQAREQVRPAVERQIKRDLVLERLIQEHDAEPTNEDFQARLKEIAERNDLSVSEVRQRLAKEKRLDTLRRDMAVGKVMDMLLEQSTIG
ncbi:MAG: trigger factor [Gemmatimonadota bacterium]|nr:trigger factor [Gemmatimonadota bacterium]